MQVLIQQILGEWAGDGVESAFLISLKVMLKLLVPKATLLKAQLSGSNDDFHVSAGNLWPE